MKESLIIVRETLEIQAPKISLPGMGAPYVIFAVDQAIWRGVAGRSILILELVPPALKIRIRETRGLNPLPVVNVIENMEEQPLSNDDVKPLLSDNVLCSQEILLCGPASLVQAFINEHPAKLLVDTGASMSIVKNHFNVRTCLMSLWVLGV